MKTASRVPLSPSVTTGASSMDTTGRGSSFRMVPRATRLPASGAAPLAGLLSSHSVGALPQPDQHAVEGRAGEACGGPGVGFRRGAGGLQGDPGRLAAQAVRVGEDPRIVPPGRTSRPPNTTSRLVPGS